MRTSHGGKVSSKLRHRMSDLIISNLLFTPLSEEVLSTVHSDYISNSLRSTHKLITTKEREIKKKNHTRTLVGMCPNFILPPKKVCNYILTTNQKMERFPHKNRYFTL